MSAAIFIDLRAICSALTLFSVISARAADNSKGPPEKRLQAMLKQTLFSMDLDESVGCLPAS